MRLVDLDPGWGRDPDRGLLLMLLCPKCGNHHVGIPVKVGVKEPGYWKITSQDLNSLTVDPSVMHGPLPQECLFHFRVTNGEIEMC